MGVRHGGLEIVYGILNDTRGNSSHNRGGTDCMNMNRQLKSDAGDFVNSSESISFEPTTDSKPLFLHGRVHSVGCLAILVITVCLTCGLVSSIADLRHLLIWFPGQSQSHGLQSLESQKPKANLRHFLDRAGFEIGSDCPKRQSSSNILNKPSRHSTS